MRLRNREKRGILFPEATDRFSGYLRGFGVFFIPAACLVIGICGVRLTWVFTVFRQSPSFATIMKPSKRYIEQAGR